MEAYLNNNSRGLFNTYLFLLIIGLVFQYSDVIGQPIDRARINHQSLTIKAVDGREKVKDFLNNLNAQLENQLTYETRDQVITLLDNKRQQCINTDDKMGCEAGVSFAGAYRFHLEAENDPDHESEYLTIAKNYYRETLRLQPDHQSALKNLVQLNVAQEKVDTAIFLLKQMIEKYPEDRSKNLVRIGDLYLEQDNTTEACNYFKQAYDENSASGEVCDRVTNMYLLHKLQCFKTDNFLVQKSSAVSLFAVSCSAAGLPNYAERMLRQQILYTVEVDESEKIGENILLWTDILIDNKWLDSRRIEDLIQVLSSEKTTDQTTLVIALAILKDLALISKAIKPQDLPQIGFWVKQHPEIELDYSRRISPLLIMIKTLQYKGSQAIIAGNFENAENCLNEAFQKTYKEKTLTTKVAKDLVELYGSYPELDSGGIKLGQVINRLFDDKMDAYLSNDAKMIREFHIALGRIFYDQQKWYGGGYANALFQLEHALSNKLGPIVNPELRIMLGDVYTHIKTGEAKAVDAYIEGAKDMLLVDRVDEAEVLVKRIVKLAKSNNDSLRLKELSELSRLIDIRVESANPKNHHLKDSTYVSQYLAIRAKEEARFTKYFSKDFVNIEYFKCYSDLGMLIGPFDQKSQQILFVEALNKVAMLNSLHSQNDFKRIQEIKRALDKSIDRPYLMRPVQMNVMYKLPYESSGKQDDDKVIQLYSLGKFIHIPNSLFELGSSVKEYYNINKTREIPRYQYNNLKVNLINNKIKNQ